ncbi:radical SAM protein with 4Fe4S-binding SPASM domain [Anaerobacterium chartisolvens]|uniref:Radical SAM protein with 4Fe4S-binding SPASM domain n=1 Tax=Anaerobacterium chartisolvens TaxID=1297424 RepID=A0A369BCX7_9FIRM|nr:PqqD family peptide modification chaperone [Anaerobacterium chartisolvens]RCX19412.1 radical SAM protein with 4Fe4S-binding SPASM domain [Anaerobacterium chartisolvens]
MQTVNEKTCLFDNYTNFLHKVDDYESIIENGHDTYILFNPSIHYWITLDEIGAAIYNEIHNNSSMDIVKKNLIDKFSIDDSTFNEDVLPFAQELAKNGFLSFDKTAAEAAWMSESYNIDTVESYPFNDIYISLTDKCNLNCIYCFNKEERHNRISKSSDFIISKEKVVEVLNEFKALKGSKVIFTGGEPTLNNHLIDICSEAKKIGLETHFITNGTLLNSIDIGKLAEYADGFTISLDSVIEEELEVLWGNPHISLDKSIFTALEKINEFSSKEKKITVIIKPIVSALNINSLDKLVSVLYEKLNNCDLSWGMTQYGKIEDAEVNELLSVTEKEYIKSVARSLKNTYLSDKENKQRTPEETKKVHNRINMFSFCHGARLLPPTSPNLLSCNPSFYIASNGDVYPCQCFENEKYKIGNVLEDSLSNMFENEIFKRIRSKLPINKIDSKVCLKCEFRFLCTNKLGPCEVSKDRDMTNCKRTNIQKLFLQTQL